MVPQLPIHHVNSFGEAFDHALVAASGTATGTVLGLLVNRADASRVLAHDDANGASFAETRVNPPYEATVVEHDGQRVVREVELVASLAYPDVQTFHDGDILIAGARCRRFDDGTAEANAQIYTSAGELSAQFTIGDAVAHLRIDVHDQIWAGSRTKASMATMAGIDLSGPLG